MAIGISTKYVLGSNQTFTSNATLADITGFTQPIVAGQTVHGRARLYFSVGATGGVRFQVTTPLLGTLINGIILSNPVTPATILTTQTAINTPFTNALAVAGTHFIDIEFTYTSVAAGNLSLQTAQNTSDALTYTVIAGSWLELTVI